MRLDEAAGFAAVDYRRITSPIRPLMPIIEPGEVEDIDDQRVGLAGLQPAGSVWRGAAGGGVSVMMRSPPLQERALAELAAAAILLD